MKTKVCVLLICLFAIAGLALPQARVDGKWTAVYGIQMMTMTLKSDGGKLTGTFEGFLGPIPIEEGTVSSNTLKFKVKGQGPSLGRVFTYTGVISGNEIKFVRQAEDGQGMPQEFTAKRGQ